MLNAVIVLGGALTRHAAAEPPYSPANAELALELPSIAEETDSRAASKDNAVSEQNASFPNKSAGTEPTTSLLPEVPSLEDLPPATHEPGPNILGIEDFKRVFSESSPVVESLTNSNPAMSEQLSQSYFEALQLRLNSVKHFNKASQGLVAEASILFHRGEIREAQELLGMATKLREMAAKLLVTRQ